MSDIYNKFRKPPQSALRKITGGRLSGKTDINPQWRYESLDEEFGVCGIGWKYELVDFFTLPGASGEVAAFARINLYIKQNDKWSDPIPGFGGSMLVSKEKSGLNTSDEAYKMSITDALSVACKMLGIGADIYAGCWDGTKYIDSNVKPSTSANPDKPRSITNEQFKELQDLGTDMINLAKAFKVPSVTHLTYEQAEQAIAKKKGQSNA